MTEIMESITINNFLTGMFMTGSLWGTLLLSRMLLPLPQGLTRHSRNNPDEKFSKQPFS
jgi:hypothetical protein